jgi:hypothetical protein
MPIGCRRQRSRQTLRPIAPWPKPSLLTRPPRLRGRLLPKGWGLIAACRGNRNRSACQRPGCPVAEGAVSGDGGSAAASADSAATRTISRNTRRARCSASSGANPNSRSSFAPAAIISPVTGGSRVDGNRIARPSYAAQRMHGAGERRQRSMPSRFGRQRDLPPIVPVVRLKRGHSAVNRARSGARFPRSGRVFGNSGLELAWDTRRRRRPASYRRPCRCWTAEG